MSLKYRLKKKYQGKHIALPNGLLISDDFFGVHGFKGGNAIIESSDKVAQYFTNLEGEDLDISNPKEVDLEAALSDVEEGIAKNKEEIQAVLERNDYREMQRLTTELDLDVDGRAREDYEAALRSLLD